MLSLNQVTAGYGGATVLRDVNVNVPEGSVVALLGANGAGKTTLLRVASGLLRPSRGAILLGDEDLAGKEPHYFARRGICHIPEGRGVFPSMTVRDNLMLQAPEDLREQLVQSATEAFPVLRNRIDQIAGTLSGGEQQMLALSRTLVPGGRVILLDEVSLGLAPKVVDEIFEFLAELAATGISLLLVEQYVVTALGLADYVYVMERGHIGFAGEPGELDAAEVFERYIGAPK